MCEVWILILIFGGWILSGLTFICYYRDCRRNKALVAYYEKKINELKRAIHSRDINIELIENKYIELAKELKKRKKKKKK